MLKRLALIVAILFIPALAKADSFLSVVMEPEVFHVAGDETVGVTFIWDITTQQIFDITMTATGTFWQGVDHLPPAHLAVGTVPFFNFANQAGDVFQLNYSDHAFSFTPFLTSTPGIYLTDLFLTCPQCVVHGVGSIDGDGPGRAIVTSLGDGDHDGDDPVSTPEPSSLVSVLAGLATMAFAIYAMRCSSTTLSSFGRLRA
jgi:hypothetical protein